MASANVYWCFVNSMFMSFDLIDRCFLLFVVIPFQQCINRPVKCDRVH